MKTISLPSKEVYKIDTPEINNFSARFVYNFFVQDESVNENSNSSSHPYNTSPTETSERQEKIFNSRVPRYVSLEWVPPNNVNGESANNFEYIKRNYTKIVNETQFTSGDYISLHFNDQGVIERLSNVNLDVSENIIDSSINALLKRNYISDLAKNSVINNLTLSTPNLVSLINVQPNSSGETLNEAEFRTLFPYVEYIEIDSIYQKSSAVVAGYVIDKYEILENGTTQYHPPIIIGSKSISKHLDLNVKYGSKYVYSIRAITKLNIVAIDVESNVPALIICLLSSNSSSKKIIECIELVNPPSPTDLDFSWGYGDDSLMIHWTFPPNPQRDIKAFQVFRRSSLNMPFELIKQFDFNDSDKKVFHFSENVLSQLNEKLTSAKTFFVDEQFNKKSDYIYTVCSIDAHGLSSNYSPQFRVKFSTSENSITKELISRSGAPKQYPNFFVENKGTVEVGKISGSSFRRMNLFFTPQCINLMRKNRKIENLVSTKNTGGGTYIINLLNVDNQVSEKIEINIDDITGYNL
jgi:hypothetical protein